MSWWEITKEHRDYEISKRLWWSYNDVLDTEENILKLYRAFIMEEEKYKDLEQKRAKQKNSLTC